MQLQTILCVVPSIVFKPYVCKWYVYVCVCLLMIILKRVYHNLYVCMYMCMYLVCQDSSLSDHRSYLSPLPFSFSERSVTISGNRCILFRTRLIVLRSSKVIRIGAAVLVNESGWTFVEDRCWRSIDDEKGAIIFTYFLFSLNDDLTILKDSIINLKNVSS